MKDIDDSDLEKRIIEALRTVHDPEIPVNIYDLGLIYDLSIDEAGRVRVAMTLTAPNCPVADKIPVDVAEAIRSVDGVNEVNVSLVWEPEWSPERMSEIGRLELQAMGIDPDRAKESVTSRPTGVTIDRRSTGLDSARGKPR